MRRTFVVFALACVLWPQHAHADCRERARASSLTPEVSLTATLEELERGAQRRAHVVFTATLRWRIERIWWPTAEETRACPSALPSPSREEIR